MTTADERFAGIRQKSAIRQHIVALMLWGRGSCSGNWTVCSGTAVRCFGEYPVSWWGLVETVCIFATCHDSRVTIHVCAMPGFPTARAPSQSVRNLLQIDPTSSQQFVDLDALDLWLVYSRVAAGHHGPLRAGVLMRQFLEFQFRLKALGRMDHVRPSTRAI